MRDPQNPAPAARRQQPTPPTETEPEQQQQSTVSGPGAAGAFTHARLYTPEQVLLILKNSGIDVECGVCMCQAFTGSGHSCGPHTHNPADLLLQGFNDCEALIIEMLEQGADAAIERGSRERNVDKKVEEAVRAMVLRNAALAIRLGQHRRQPPIAEGRL